MNRTAVGAGREAAGPHSRSRMRPWSWAAMVIALGAALVFSGCESRDDDADDDWCWNPDHTAPVAPTCLWSVTGDDEVLILWCANTEEDLDGYRIYRSTRSDGYFPRLASVGEGATSFVDHDVRNGETYWYVLSAFDRSGNESELTPDAIHDTPRPDGSGLRIYNGRLTPDRSGYDFSQAEVLDFRELEADVYFWQTDNEGAWMIATERSDDEYTDIQDAGYLALDDVDWAPANGWAPSGEVPLIEGHTYVVWTWDDHYAKFRVADLSSERVIVEWAYQTDRGNPELFHPNQAVGTLKAPLDGRRSHAKGQERRIES